MGAEEEVQGELIRRMAAEAASAIGELHRTIAALRAELASAKAEVDSAPRRLYEVRVVGREKIGGREAHRVSFGPDGPTHLVVIKSGDVADAEAVAADVQANLGSSVLVVVASPGTEVAVAEILPSGSVPHA